MTQDPRVLLWEREMIEGGLPSSQRHDASGAVVWALTEMRRHQLPLRRAIDIGCGKGRNSLYLAAQGMAVTALDFTPGAIAALHAALGAQPAAVRALLHDVTEPWPVPPDHADLAIDSFCFKHITGKDGRLAYKQNLLRALTARGCFLLSFASIGDGYYGRYILREDDGAHVALDPVNGIESVLFSRDHVVDFFAPELTPLATRFSDAPRPMHSQNAPRATYAILFQHRLVPKTR